MRFFNALLYALLLAAAAAGSDWPTYRGDAARSGSTPDALPTKLAPAWSYHPRHAPQPAWPRDERLSFDRGYAVVIADGRLFFGSSTDGTVYALDAETGRELWTFVTDGPVRFAPAVWRDRVFVVSDDGFLYCLNAADGRVLDRWRGGSEDSRVLGNERMISRWPARGGPAIVGDVVYWAAGIWQSEGIFVYAMRAETGEILWKNSDSGSIDMPQPHGGANAVSGVTAQGYLAANDDQIFVSTGRAVPAAFARPNGAFQYYRLQENGQRGGALVMTGGDLVYNGGAVYQAADGQLIPTKLEGVVCRFPGGILLGAKDRVAAFTVGSKQVPDRKGQPVQRTEHELAWELTGVPAGSSLILAGETIVSAAGPRLATVDAATRQIAGTHEVDAPVFDLAAAAGRLYVSTERGTIHCFAATTPGEAVVHRPAAEAPAADERIAAAAQEILRESGVRAGYCVDLGCGDGSLALELARRSDLYVVAIDADESNVARARAMLAQAGFYGTRVTVHQGSPSDTRFPRYFANLVVSARSLSGGPDEVDRNEVLRLQRPCGGVACLGKPGALHVSRRGPLDGAGDWTHQYADAANTLCSIDSVNGPLRVLWFRDVDLDLPQRHGRGPAPLYSDGRLFVEGLDELVAVDAYNGWPLWRYGISGVLRAYDADHLAGTAITGSNFCLAPDSVLVRYRDRCDRLDAATGEVLATYTAPPQANGQPGTWGYLAYEDGVVYGSLANPEHIVRHAYLRADDHMRDQFSESGVLFALDLASGNLLWRYDAEQSLRHNAIALGGGRVFLVDRALAEGDLLANTPEQRRGEAAPVAPHAPGKMLALDAKTGHTLWTSENAFGTMLIYSQPHELLVACYQATRFKLPSEVGDRMAVYRAADGGLIWDQKVKYATRPLLNDRLIVAYPSAVDLLTGEAHVLDFLKSYGCGQLAGSKNLLLFRSATLGYYDLQKDSETANYGGIRPGCWINALPVGGLVLFPDASAGCRCSYQNRAWMALEGESGS